MHNFSEIHHYCYYDPDKDNAVVGVSPNELIPLSNYPYEIISYEMAKPFYDGNRGYGGAYCILKHRDEVIIVKAENNQRLTKRKSLHPLYQIENIQNKKIKIEEYDFLLEFITDKFFLTSKTSITPLIDISKYHNKTHKIHVTKKNNPYFLISSISFSIEKNEVPHTFDFLNESYYVSNSSGNYIFADLNIKTSKAFIMYNIIELNKTIITANVLKLNAKDLQNKSIKVLKTIDTIPIEKDIKALDLVDTFLEINDVTNIIKEGLEYCEVKDISLSDLPNNWISKVIEDDTSESKIIFNKKILIVLWRDDFNGKINIFNKNNPFAILTQVNTETQIVKNNIDGDIECSIYYEDKIKKIPTVRMND